MLYIHAAIRRTINISISAVNAIRSLDFLVIAAAKYAIIIKAATIMIAIKNTFII